ncbi:Rotatin [Echinococcus granulosus]|uniref:Rotatin n=1 Tax=Echinococcus granulosus TaxID=6210 RepID=W6UUY2_ECHGR|nr:Rotatin [Echinococcus granulosus]EUB64436.1 Rotatin [Echinococcus granulosus]
MSAFVSSSLLPPSVIQVSPKPTLPTLCVAIMSAALSGFTSPRAAVQGALLRLLNTSVDVFLGCTHVGAMGQLVALDFLGTVKPPSEDSLPSHNVTPGFDDMLELWGIMLSAYSRDWRSDLNSSGASEGCRQQKFEHSRSVYVGLLRALFRLLSALWTPESCSRLLPSVTSFELSLGLLDCHLIYPATAAVSTTDAVGLSAYVRLLDPEIALLRGRLVNLLHVATSAVAFVRGLYSLQGAEKSALEDLMKQAVDGLGAVEFFFESYIPKFVKFLSEMPLIVEESICGTLLAQGRSYLLMLLAHPFNGIRKVTYAQIWDVLSTNISINLAADPTSFRYKCLTFVLTPEILGEIVEFGLHDSVPEIVSTAQTCLRILLDAHQLIPQPMWLLLVNLLVESPNETLELNCLPTSADWRPLKPLLSLGIAPLAASPGNELLTERVLDACLGVGGFADVHPIPLAPLLPLLYLPLSTVRLKAAELIVRILATIFHVVEEVIEVVLSVEETLCDLLLFASSEATPSVKEVIFHDVVYQSPTVMNDFSELVAALDNALDLVTDEVATVEVRRAAGEQVLAIITSPIGLTCWHEVGGPPILIGWISTLPSAVGQTLASKLLIEPIVLIQLAIAHYIITHDFDSRTQLYLNQSTCLLPLLFIGLCFWKVDEIRRCVSTIIALVIFTPAIRFSDESPVCLPQAIVRSFCLPFVCPIYYLQSRHCIEQPDFSRLLQHLINARSLSALSSQRTRVVTVAVVRALRVIWHSLLEGEVTLATDPLLKCTATESAIIEATQLSSAIPRALHAIRMSKSHIEASVNMSHLHLLSVVFWRSPKSCMTWWHEADLARFLQVLPSCTDDYRLLIHCLQTLTNLNFSPPYCNPNTISMSKWMLEEIMTTASPLSYLMRRFDAGVGATDSRRLVEAKSTLHFHTLPRLFDALLACEDFVADVDVYALEQPTPVVSSGELSRKEEKWKTPGEGACPNRTRAEHCITPTSQDTSPAFSSCTSHPQSRALRLSVKTGWTSSALSCGPVVLSARSAHVDEYKQTSWIAGVQQIDATLRELFQQTIHLIRCILEAEKHACLHGGILYSSLALLHNALLLLTSECRDSITSFEAYSISPWLFQLTHQGYNMEIRCLTVTLLAQVVLLNNFEEKSPDIWNMAFSLLLNSTESPKMRAAAAHLLANLTARFQEIDFSVDSEISDNPLVPTFVDPQTENVENPQNGSLRQNSCAFSTPLLIGRVCSFLANLCHALPPEFILRNFEENRLCVALMKVINPKLLHRLTASRDNSRPNIMAHMAARHSASAFTQILRLFRLLFSISPQQKLTFFSDLRFLTLLATGFSCFSLDSVDLRSLCKETMLFFIAILEPETEGAEDFLLRHALYPLASQVHQWGPLIDRLLRGVVDLNGTSPTGGSACSDVSRLTTFELLHVALIFLSVILSCCASHTFEALKQPNASDSSTIAPRFVNPVPAALDAAASGQIATALISLETSFPHPRIDLDGVLLDSGVAEGGDPESPHMFWHLEINRQAVHSALKILFCTSSAAKKAALEGDYLDTLFALCRNLVERLNLIVKHPTRPRNANFVSSPAEVSPPSLLKKRAFERRQLAWQCLTAHLLRHLELLGNLIYGSPEVKKAVVEAGFPKLVLDIWPLGLIDSRVMYNLLFCLINLSADSLSASSVIAAATTPTNVSTTATASSLRGEVPPISACTHPTTGIFSLFCAY